MRLIVLAVAMMMNFNIVAQMSLTLENTTPGTTEYNSHRPKHGSVIFDDNNNLIRDTDKTKWDSLINVLYNKDIYYQSTCYDRCSRNGNIAYKKGDTLFVFTAHNKTSKAITTPQNGIVVAEAVHRNEFGINKGTFWSEQGNKLAYYEMDESMVSEYPIVDITQRIAKVRPLRYPMAGETSHEVKVKIYDTQKELENSNVTIELQKKIAEGYTTDSTLLEAVNGSTTQSGGQFAITGIPRLNLKFSELMEPGDYQLLFTIYDNEGNEVKTVSYKFVVI